MDMKYCDKEKVATGAELSGCLTAEIAGVHLLKNNFVEYSDKQVSIIPVSLEESLHSDLSETAMEPTDGDASATQIFCNNRTCESYEGEEGGEKEEHEPPNVVNGMLFKGEATQELSHELHDDDEENEMKKKAWEKKEAGEEEISSAHKEDESHHILVNGKLPLSDSSPNMSHESHDSYESHDLHDGEENNKVKKKPEEEEEEEARSHDSHECDGLKCNDREKVLTNPIQEEYFSGVSPSLECRKHDTINRDAFQKPSCESRAYDGNKGIKKPEEEEEGDDDGRSHCSSFVEGGESIEDHEEGEEAIDKNEGNILSNGVVIDQIGNYNVLSTFVPSQASILGIKFGSVDCGDGILPLSLRGSNFGFNFPGPSPIYHLNINGGPEIQQKAGVADEPEAELEAEPEAGVVGEPEVYVVVEPEAGVVVEPEVDVVVEPEAGVVVEPEAGVLIGPEAGFVVGPEAGFVVGQDAGFVVSPEAGVVVSPEAGVVVGSEVEVAVEPESSMDEATDYIGNMSEVGGMGEEQGRDGGVSYDIWNGEKTPPELEKRGFYYLIKIPRFKDDDIRENVKDYQLLVDEKTRIRDSIRSKIQDIKASLKEHGDKIEAAISEEKSARDAHRLKRREIDSVMNVINKVKNAMSINDIDTKIRNTEHTMEHGSIKLAEEKKLIQEIKQLKSQRDQLASNLDNNEDLNQALAQRDQMDKRLKELRKEAACLWEGVSRMEQATKEARKGYFGEREKLNGLQSEFKEADNARQMAYAGLTEQRKQLSDKNKYFRMYKQNAESAYGYAAAHNREELQSLCINQVEKVMSLWNSDLEFRSDYITANTRSTLWRLKTLDGRSLGPGDDPLAPTALPTPPEPPTHIITLPKKQPSAPPLTEPPQNEPDRHPPTKNMIGSEKPGGPPELAGAEAARAAAEEVEGEEAAERRRAEALAKLREEQRVKEKEAEQRKLRNMEKARARAEFRAQKEAEQKQKEREKRARKRERKKRAAEGDGAEKNESLTTTSSILEENPSRAKGGQMAVATVKSTGREKVGAKVVGRKSGPPPRLLLKKRGRRWSRFLWAVPVVIVTISALGFLMWANTWASPPRYWSPL